MADPLANGLSALPGLSDSFASVQAAWRFYANERITLPVLIEPPHQAAQAWRRRREPVAGLVVHDWSSLKYPGHKSKTDQARLSHSEDWGYELATALLVDGGDGNPVAPLEMRLRTAQEVHSTRTPAPDPEAFRIDEVLATMQACDRLNLGRLVHVIDREADSLAHYRQWQADGRQFVIRADGERKVRWQGEETSLADLGQRLGRQGVFRRSRDVVYHDSRAVRHTAETTVVLDRPAWRNRRRGGKATHERLAGEAVTFRLIVSRVCNARGETLAEWYLLTNVSAETTTETVALWYYWRWRIESFFKLLKSAGQQLENGQQETGGAVAKRLLVAAMACVLVWTLQSDPSPPAASLRRLLVQLSGRQMRRGKSHTAPALLAGLQVFLAMLEALDHHSLDDLREFRLFFLGQENSG